MTIGPSAAAWMSLVVAVFSVVADDTLAQRRPESSSPNLEPRVLGFGVDAQLDPVPGFGGQRSWTDVITDRDRREAEGVMRRFDLNQNKQLDPFEVRLGPWSSDFYQVDMDADGFVSLSELSLRYARRRMDREAASARPFSSDDSGGRRDMRSQADGESSSGRMRVVRGARSFDGERSRGVAGNSSRGGEENSSRSESAKLSESSRPKSYRFKSRYERESFLSGLSRWFKERDANLDGQVLMGEYVPVWTDELVAEFRNLDLNGDGVIVRRECLAAAENGFEPSVHVQHSVRAVAKTPVPRRSMSPTELPSRSRNQEPSPLRTTPLPTSLPASYKTYARGVMQKHDADRDGVLTSSELQTMPQDPTAADTDHDDEITVDELAWWYVRHR